MDKRARVALVCEGDASRSETAFSGTAKRIYESLSERGHHVVPVDASLSRLKRLAVAATNVSTDKARWRSKFRYGNESAKFRAAAALQSLGNQKVDLIVQVGATFDPPRSEAIPYAIFADWNLALSIGEVRENGNNRYGLTLSEMEAIDREHARRYQGAAAIFTISERLRRAFLELYNLAPERVHTVYAGPNFDFSLIEATLAEPKRSLGCTILFIAKEFQRKGGDIVAAAYGKLKLTMPQARLVFAGTAALPAEFRGFGDVEHLGLLDKTNPEQLQRLLSAYRNADVLVLPSRHDPFPTVIREAMFFGLPAVASDIWAMSEMIEDGRTGFLVPVGDADALAAKLKLLLSDASLRARQGVGARARAEAMFSWKSVGRALSEGIERALESSR
jgi:glycosyltransferase involved in cell wall biosynthesis